MRKFRYCFLATTVLLLAACGASKPSVKLLASASYSDSANALTVDFYQLSDGSLSFIRVTKPDGSILTLPQMVAASGTRYTDGIQAEYWFKGEDLYISTLSESGEWILTSEMKQVQ